MKRLFLVLLTTLFFYVVSAGEVPKRDAEIVAVNYYYQAVNSFDTHNYVNYTDIRLNCIVNPEVDKSSHFYAFNINDDQGYVLVSSSDAVKPILAFSFEQGFNNGNIAPGQQLFLDYFNESIKTALDNNIQADEKASAEWNSLLSYKPGETYKQKTTVPSLLGEIKWNQSSPYNGMCPEADGTPAGYGGRCPVGCVATAMLQVMKYYNWPAQGEGSYFHSSWWNGGHGNYNINFGQSTYDWYSIPNSGSGPNDELAKVNLHAGVAVKMYWTASGSGTQTSEVEDALQNFFRYKDDVVVRSKGAYSENNWKTLLRNQIDARQPMVYSGSPSGGGAGHAWNCDGYMDDDHFHMNWGWGGYGDGFYTLDNLNSTATPGAPDDNFNASQQAVINIYPDGNYPTFCSGTKLITGHQGSFGDGSSTSNYQNNQNCTYVIKPECGQIINLRFDEFNLAAGDEVRIYDGDQTSDILVETFDMNNEPGSDQYTFEKGALTIRFITDGSQNSEGWAVNYSVRHCKTNISMTEPSGVFDDGSGVCDYESSTVCSWIIEPPGATEISIDFTKFLLAGGADFVRVYKSSVSGANLLYTFTQANPPSSSIVINDPKAAIQFFADAGDVNDGWEISYTTNTTGIENDNLYQRISLIPNPGNNNSVVMVESNENSTAVLQIYNILGKLINSVKVNITEWENAININEISNRKLNNGVYLINVETESNTYSERFIIME
jgi:hypothetical protein